MVFFSKQVRMLLGHIVQAIRRMEEKMDALDQAIAQISGIMGNAAVSAGSTGYFWLDPLCTGKV